MDTVFDILRIVGIGVGGLFLVYLISRISTAGVMRSIHEWKSKKG